jgi:hypothetical protein
MGGPPRALGKATGGSNILAIVDIATETDPQNFATAYVDPKTQPL